MNIRSWCRIVNIRSASQPAAFRSEHDWGAPSDLAHQEGGCCRSCIAGLAMDHVVQAWLKTALIGGSWRKPGRMVVASLSCSEIHRTRRLSAICHRLAAPRRASQHHAPQQHASQRHDRRAIAFPIPRRLPACSCSGLLLPLHRLDLLSSRPSPQQPLVQRRQARLQIRRRLG
jgi:hypothetical protein